MLLKGYSANRCDHCQCCYCYYYRCFSYHFSYFTSLLLCNVAILFSHCIVFFTSTEVLESLLLHHYCPPLLPVSCYWQNSDYCKYHTVFSLIHVSPGSQQNPNIPPDNFNPYMYAGLQPTPQQLPVPYTNQDPVAVQYAE